MAADRGQQENRRDGSILLFTVLSIVCFVLISISDQGNSERPKDIAFQAMSTTQKGVHATISWFSGTLNSINELKQLKTDYQNALSTIESYYGIEREVLELRRENEELKNQLEFINQSDYESIPAEIIAKDPGNLFTTIIIDKGTRHGLDIGMTVIAYQGDMFGLVGRIINVGVSSAMVKPITEESSFIAGRCYESRYEGLINGVNGNSEKLIMKYITKSAIDHISVNELVVTSGLSSVYPRNIFIGRVSAIQAKEYDSSLELEIKPVIDFNRLEYLIVLKEKE